MPRKPRAFRKDAKLTVRLTPYEWRRLDLIRRHGRPSLAPLRPAAQCAVDAILRLADALNNWEGTD